MQRYETSRLKVIGSFLIWYVFVLLAYIGFVYLEVVVFRRDISFVFPVPFLIATLIGLFIGGFFVIGMGGITKLYIEGENLVSKGLFANQQIPIAGIDKISSQGAGRSGGMGAKILFSDKSFTFRTDMFDDKTLGILFKSLKDRNSSIQLDSWANNFIDKSQRKST